MYRGIEEWGNQANRKNMTASTAKARQKPRHTSFGRFNQNRAIHKKNARGGPSRNNPLASVKARAAMDMRMADKLKRKTLKDANSTCGRPIRRNSKSSPAAMEGRQSKDVSAAAFRVCCRSSAGSASGYIWGKLEIWSQKRIRP